jgi:hypothetical protein
VNPDFLAPPGGISPMPAPGGPRERNIHCKPLANNIKGIVSQAEFKGNFVNVFMLKKI